MLPQGTWRVELDIQNQKLPFLLETRTEKGRQVAYIRNGEEKLLLNEFSQSKDSISATLHIFDAVLRGKLENGKVWRGYWQKLDTKKPYLVPFVATLGESARFVGEFATPTANFSGKWDVTFKSSDGQTYPSVGIFQQKGAKITGTFLTTTGDYRYLEGVVSGNTFMMSAFDGNHAFSFKATQSDKGLAGEFWAGKGGYETFTAVRNESASLPDANSLTYLKEGFERLEFSFPNTENKTISLQDERYKGKVVIIQLFGSWCPNCMDETAFLAPYYAKNKNRDIEIIGLAYERSPNFEQAKTRLEKLKKRYQVEYELLVAGISDKVEASKTLPALNAVLAFPTTIFIDKKGKVRRIHTGFTGAGTGAYYEKFKDEFRDFVNQLLEEE
ncbi:MAG: TlpA family protein disulfide reductase [Bacteroidetes bacterium]|nr:MAG: TlpA family protein disulfide reductase [Bacteroidota bacterium]